MPVMMFSGVLKTEAKFDVPVDRLFDHLNKTMYDSLDSRTFVCFVMCELDTATRSIDLANGGCPYPYHYKASTGEIAELEADALPLGIRAQATYPVVEMTVDSGDYFYSDGIIEAANLGGDLFGFGRAAETVRAGSSEGLSAEALIDRLIGAVNIFADVKPQGDDMTCLVLRVEG